jgi:hypothetical protein
VSSPSGDPHVWGLTRRSVAPGIMAEGEGAGSVDLGQGASIPVQGPSEPLPPHL